MTTTEYLQREIRRTELSVRRAERKPNTPAEELRGLREKLEHLQETLDAVNEHWQRVHEQRGWAAGEPLTLEQLRGMDGQPVYWATAKQWFIVQLEHPYFGDCVINTSGYYLPLCKAACRRFYAHKPARIDREKWEPCKWCVLNGQFGLNNYCSACGRPLTEEAWAELERRVCGG